MPLFLGVGSNALNCSHLFQYNFIIDITVQQKSIYVSDFPVINSCKFIVYVIFPYGYLNSIISKRISNNRVF